MSEKMPSIAVVGSGPSGCYTAQFLARKWPRSEIVVFEAQPAPYGLVRYGVAPDHQGNKGVIRQFDRLFGSGQARFVGNVTVGRDIPFSQLADAFDIVVLATGLPDDRELPVPQDAGARVIGAGRLLKAFNAHPAHVPTGDKVADADALGQRVAVVGGGNVAMDVVRLLCKEEEELAGSDLDDESRDRLRPRRPTAIDVVCRSRASDARCDLAMVREVLELPGISVEMTGYEGDEGSELVDMLLQRAMKQGEATTELRFRFGLAPERVETHGAMTVLYARSNDGARSVAFEVDAIVTAIGFAAGPAEDDGHVRDDWSGDHVHRVGWLRRGPIGTIAENRKDARAVADRIIAAVDAGTIVAGKPGFPAMEPFLHGEVVDFNGWRRVDAAEIQQAAANRCRGKISDPARMLAIANSATVDFGARDDARPTASTTVLV